AFAALLYLPESASLGALILIVLYATFYANAALRSLTARAQPRALFAGLLLLSLAAWFAQAQYLSPQFWYAEDSQSEDGSDEAQTYLAQRQQAEALMYSQSDLIDEAADAMTRPDDLESAAFFVGFAGMGEQHVFASEIELAEHVIAEKYETGSRSLRLVNDRRDLEAYPLANPTALRRALADVAAKMDLESDVLFLALSSHGSPNGELSVSNLGMPLNNLSARDLADALEGSGILWRVVIVSACYSGTFIEPLRNDHTIIITASAADRTSFGCSDDRDLTYFGEAFYRDALPNAPDLRTAFQRMKTLIAEREKQEDIEPSNPQAYFGTAIERHLKALVAD
ncbi:MAG: C13 family peptidase, partial [Povalibacter sp.]